MMQETTEDDYKAMAATCTPFERGKLFFEQNNLLFSRIQTAYLIEAGTLAGYYVLMDRGYGGLAAGLIVLSVILLLLLLGILQRDAQILKKMRDEGWLPLGRAPRWFGFSGKGLTLAVPIVLIIANLILASLTLTPNIEVAEKYQRHGDTVRPISPGR